MTADKITFAKLKGSSNYSLWAIRAEAYLTREGLYKTISNDPNPLSPIGLEDEDKALATIRLILEDGPLVQIQHKKTAKDAWLALSDLYSPKGFASEFLVIKEFFDATLSKFSSIEEYLNKIKELTDQLEAKELILPRTVIIGWVLNNLSDDYEGLISNITQSLRNNAKSYTLETLFSSLLDESKRLENRENNHPQAFLTTRRERGPVGKYKAKNSFKAQKGKFCTYCKLSSHEAKNCFFLFPEKAPAKWQKRDFHNEKTPKTTQDNNTAILLANSSQTPEIPSSQASQATTASGSMDLDINLDFEGLENLDIDYQVFTILENPYNPITANNAIAPADLKAGKSSIGFILDSGASRHIISNKGYFSTYTECNKSVSWGKAKTIQIKAIGHVKIRFKDTKVTYILKDCLYMPELGYNLISQSKLVKDYYTIYFKDKVILRGNNDRKLITIGYLKNSLYYLNLTIEKETTNKKQLISQTINNKSINNKLIHNKSINNLLIKDKDSIINTNSNTNNNTNSNSNTNTNSKTNSNTNNSNTNTNSKTNSNTNNSNTNNNTNSSLLWHYRLGHIYNIDKLKSLGLTNISNLNIPCEICLQGKFTNKINKTTTTNKQLEYLDKIASDICGPILPIGYNNNRYFITFLDKATRYLSIKLLKAKSETYTAFREYKQLVENNNTNKRIKLLATDNGTEYINKKLSPYLINNGIIHQKSAIYTPEQNGLAERINRTLWNKARCMLRTASLHNSLWKKLY